VHAQCTAMTSLWRLAKSGVGRRWSRAGVRTTWNAGSITRKWPPVCALSTPAAVAMATTLSARPSVAPPA
jgi:hypothetical protein